MTAKTNTIMISVILIIVAVVVIFQFVGTSSSDLAAAGNSITDANNCSEEVNSSVYDSTGAVLTYDQSTKYCQNSTGDDFYVAGQYDLPLNGLFGSSGVAFLVMMAAILVFVVVLLLKRMRGK